MNIISLPFLPDEPSVQAAGAFRQYNSAIDATDVARELNRLWTDIEHDDELSAEDRATLCKKIKDKFGSMNRAVLGNAKPSFRSI